MTTGQTDVSERRSARFAGLLYVLSFITVVGVNYGLIWPLTSGVDPAQAARNILAHETQFRAGMVGNLLHCVEVLALAAALYVVLRTVDPLLALLATLGRLVQGVTWLLISINTLTTLRLLTQPEYAHLLPPEQLPMLARLYLSGFDQYYVGLLFWTLGSTLGGWLWLRSGLVPRPLAIFGILSSAWGAACTVALFLDPGFPKLVDLNWFDIPLVLYELALGVVLMRSRR